MLIALRCGSRTDSVPTSRSKVQNVWQIPIDLPVVRSVFCKIIDVDLHSVSEIGLCSCQMRNKSRTSKRKANSVTWGSVV